MVAQGRRPKHRRNFKWICRKVSTIDKCVVLLLLLESSFIHAPTTITCIIIAPTQAPINPHVSMYSMCVQGVLSWHFYEHHFVGDSQLLFGHPFTNHTGSAVIVSSFLINSHGTSIAHSSSPTFLPLLVPTRNLIYCQFPCPFGEHSLIRFHFKIQYIPNLESRQIGTWGPLIDTPTCTRS